jgi:hypothetical protein
LFTQWDECTASAAGKETEVANTNEAAREDVKQETPKKLIGTKCHDAFPVAVSGISEAERNLFAVEGDQPVIRDGNTMRISTEVSENLIGPAEGRFTVDDPAVAE